MRLLLVGRPATSLSERLNQLTQGAITLDVARLPAEAIRRFEEVPPDAILVCDEAGGGRVSTLVKAIKHRPLGQLVPLILICPQPASQEDAQALARELELHAWLVPRSQLRSCVVSWPPSLRSPTRRSCPSCSA